MDHFIQGHTITISESFFKNNGDPCGFYPLNPSKMNCKNQKSIKKIT